MKRFSFANLAQWCIDNGIQDDAEFRFGFALDEDEFKKFGGEILNVDCYDSNDDVTVKMRPSSDNRVQYVDFCVLLPLDIAEAFDADDIANLVVKKLRGER